MRNHSKKVFLLFVLMLFFGKITYSQIDKISYSQETKDFMNANIQSGKNKFENVTSKIFIQCTDLKLTDEGKSNIINKIKAIENVLNCEIDYKTFEIVVTRKAEEGCLHYAEFKEIIAQEGLRIISNNELLFH